MSVRVVGARGFVLVLCAGAIRTESTERYPKAFSHWGQPSTNNCFSRAYCVLGSAGKLSHIALYFSYTPLR